MKRIFKKGLFLSNFSLSFLFFFFTAFTLLMTSISFTATAQEKTLVVGVEDIDYFPQYALRNNEYTGYGREILDAFAKKYGYKLVYKPMPIARLFQEFVVQQSVDLKYPDNPLWDAALKEGKKVSYSEPVVNVVVNGVVVLPKYKGRGVEKFKKMGTVTGFTSYEFADLINAGKVSRIENDNFNSLLQMTMLDRVDGAYMNIAVASYHLKNVIKQPEGLVFDPSLPYSKSPYFLSSIKRPEVIKEFNDFLIKEKETVAQIKSKYEVEIDEKILK